MTQTMTEIWVGYDKFCAIRGGSGNYQWKTLCMMLGIPEIVRFIRVIAQDTPNITNTPNTVNTMNTLDTASTGVAQIFLESACKGYKICNVGYTKAGVCFYADGGIVAAQLSFDELFKINESPILANCIPVSILDIKTKAREFLSNEIKLICERAAERTVEPDDKEKNSMHQKVCVAGPVVGTMFTPAPIITDFTEPDVDPVVAAEPGSDDDEWEDDNEDDDDEWEDDNEDDDANADYNGGTDDSDADYNGGTDDSDADDDDEVEDRDETEDESGGRSDE